MVRSTLGTSSWAKWLNDSSRLGKDRSGNV